MEMSINVALKVSLNIRYSNIEFNEVSVKSVLALIEKISLLAFEGLGAVSKLLEDWLNVFEVVLLKGLKLLNC